MNSGIEAGLDRFDRALSRMHRHGTVHKLHAHMVGNAGVECDLAAYLVLRLIELDGPLRITDMARTLGVGPSTVSRHVRLLEDKRWVRRQTDASDRRAAPVGATAEGKHTVRLVEAERRRVLTKVLQTWSDPDRERLFDLFDQFTDGLQQYAEKLG